MSDYHVAKPDAIMRKIVVDCFGYRGNTVKLSTIIPSRIHSYWDGGSRTDYAFYSLDKMCVIHEVETNHPMFAAGKPRDLGQLPARVLLVAHSIFCGKDTGITIHANQSDLAPMLPALTDDLTDNERLVLSYTKSYKNTYAGRNNVRFYEANQRHGIKLADWEAAKANMIAKGFLNKAGAITADGRNAIAGKEIR